MRGHNRGAVCKGVLGALERTQQQLDSAKDALAQSKREGEIKDQMSVSQAAELRETKLELETATQQWRDEVHRLTTELEHTKQQLDLAKGALAQSKREGEFKDQVSLLRNCATFPPFTFSLAGKVAQR